MKTIYHFSLGIIVMWNACTICTAQSVATTPSQTKLPEPTAYSITENAANSRVWEQTTYQLDPTGQVVPQKHQYNELASGLNHLVNGQWVESKEWIDVLPNGTAVATNGQHQAYFPGDIYPGQIELVTSDGKHMRSRPLGLSYFDGTNTVLIAELTNSLGVVVGSNQVIYPNAFTDLKVDLRYTYTKAGFEQDLILRQQPPTPESFGLNPDTARLQILTEFFSPPQPTVTSIKLAPQAGVALTDQSLGFGTMQMVQGRAFMLGQNAQDAGATVSKHWLLVNGRQFLLEEVPVDAIVEGLAALPLTAINSGPSKHSHTASKHLKLPPQRLAKKENSKGIMLAQAEWPMQGFLMDYQTLTGTYTNYVFRADTTYYISSAMTLNGTNTFEGGAVIKYATNASITASVSAIPTTINWRASAYHPVVFMSKDDNSAGESISGSTGNPNNFFANPALAITVPTIAQNIAYFRISNAKQAITLTSNPGDNFYHGQIINCQNGVNINVNSGTLHFRNLLFSGVKTNFNNMFQCSVDVQNSTFNASSNLTTVTSGSQTAAPVFTNCAFVNIVNLTNNPVVSFLTYKILGSYNGFYNCPNFGLATTVSSLYPYQTVGGGKCYLTNGCNFFNAGTTNIDATLLADLKLKTTYPPIAYTNVSFTLPTTFSPQAQRDFDTPDLGYHYDPLDYDFGGCFAYSNLTFTAGTAVGWFRTSSGWSAAGYGINMKAGVTVQFAGLATAFTYWTRLNTVQEQDFTAGYGQAGIETWVTSNLPWVRGQFLRCSALHGEPGSYFSDDGGTIQSMMVNCEFLGGGLYGYGDYRYFTNCLMQRINMGLLNGNTVSAFILRNCTFYGGYFNISRTSGGITPVSVRDSAFDGTAITTSDFYGSNATYTDYDYNAYTNTTYPFSLGGSHDVAVTGTFNWQKSWLGDYYQLSTGSLIDKGDNYANLFGLYHFTGQTDQTKDGNSTVDIGYHYVAVNGSGIPLDDGNGDGTPDYIEDTNGNGLVDSGELNWQGAIELGLKVWITRPGNGATPP